MLRIASYLGRTTAQGVVGWIALMLIFEGGYWATAAWDQYKRRA